LKNGHLVGEHLRYVNGSEAKHLSILRTDPFHGNQYSR